MLKTIVLFFASAFLQVLGCFWVMKAWGIRNGPVADTAVYFIAGLMVLAAFAISLAFHPAPSGRILAAYAGILAVAALVWMWIFGGFRVSALDLAGVALCLAGTMTIAYQWTRTS